MGQQLAGILDLNELLLKVISITKETINCFYANIFLLNESQDGLVSATGHNQLEKEMKPQAVRIPLEEHSNPVARAAYEKQPILIQDVQDVSNMFSQHLHPESLSEIAIPVLLEGQVVGVLDVQSDKKEGLTSSDADLLRSLTTQMAVSLNNSRLFEQTKQAEERYRMFFDHAGFAIMLVDTESLQIVTLNNVAKENYGYNDKELEGLTVLDVEVKESPEEIREHIDRIIRTGSDTFETEQRNKAGEIRNCLVSAVALKIQDKVYVQNISSDITELKNTQEKLVQSERLAALGKLTATVAHEIRNPLGTVRTSQFAIRDALERNQIERIGRAIDLGERNINRCDDIINELLEYTRKKELHLEPIEIDLWLENILDEQEIPDGIKSHRTLHSGLMASFDRLKMGTAIKNIVKNAIQAMMEEDSQGNELTVEAIKSGDLLEILITDTGIGMPEDVLENIFEPLFSTKGFGVGLGLPIVKDLMEAHGGGIEIKSKEGEGTTVVLWLPIF